MKSKLETVADLIENKRECPLPLDIIPNRMGINLVSVDAISWDEQDNGELKRLTIHFIPNMEEKSEIELETNQQVTHLIKNNAINDLKLKDNSYYWIEIFGQEIIGQYDQPFKEFGTIEYKDAIKLKDVKVIRALTEPNLDTFPRIIDNEISVNIKNMDIDSNDILLQYPLPDWYISEVKTKKGEATGAYSFEMISTFSTKEEVENYSNAINEIISKHKLLCKSKSAVAKK